MSLADIQVTVKAKQEAMAAQTRTRQQERAVMDYQLAVLIAGAVLNPSGYPETVEAAYPGLFEGPAEQEPGETDWRIIKANMAAYAAAYKMQSGGGEER